MFRKLAGLTAVAGLFFAGSASATVSGSVHDFTDDAVLGSFTDLCAVCHTPHTSDTTVADAPLWDHALTTTDFTPYPTGGTMQSTPNGDVQTLGISRLCLSCHDGTIAVDAYGTNPGTTTISAGWAGVGTGMLDGDFSSEHPIGMAYSAAGGTTQGMLATPGSGVLLFSGNVECASCHDVHDETGNESLLLTTNAGSLLCLECHVK